MFDKLAVRNIPKHVFSALESLAIAHDRSTEAEARHAIRAWVEPTLLSHERNARSAIVAERLGRLLEQLNERPCEKLKPSHIALAIGEPKAKDVEDWFLGLEEPTFAQLESIATTYGVQPKWLQHGDSSIFKVDSKMLPSNPAEAVDWLLSWGNTKGQPAATVTDIYFVREMTQTGAMAIVKRSSLGHYKIYTTTYHISEEIGAGGESNLRSLFLTWELLYKRYANGKTDLRLVESYLAHPQEYRLLYEGNTVPDLVLKKSTAAKWWEDIWHEKMQASREYWPGWTSLYQRISRSIELTPDLETLRKKIRAGEVT